MSELKRRCSSHEQYPLPYWRECLVGNRSKQNRRYYLNVASAFDIETSTIENPDYEDGKVHCPRYIAFMYSWQFAIQKKKVITKNLP